VHRLLCGAIFFPALAAAQALPLVDAHSQFDHNTPGAQVIEHAARAGVSQVLLSGRGGADAAALLALAQKHPGCVVPMVRTKGTGRRPTSSRRRCGAGRLPSCRRRSPMRSPTATPSAFGGSRRRRQAGAARWRERSDVLAELLAGVEL
jgi:hypothetical protein